jgi:N utilization substance protein B
MESKKERGLKSGLRGIARFCAVQMMYRAELCSCPIAKIVDEFDKDGSVLLSENISVSEMDRAFFRELLAAAEENLNDIDAIICANLSKNWKFERLDSVTRSILRLGIAELKCFRKIPLGVILNEYIEISKAFFDTKEVSFINGLLHEASTCLRNESNQGDEHACPPQNQ